ncbi:MAG TPA: hypothetical protein VF376_11880 [Thermoanaerobaculia bacterium]
MVDEDPSVPFLPESSPGDEIAEEHSLPAQEPPVESLVRAESERSSAVGGEVSVPALETPDAGLGAEAASGGGGADRRRVPRGPRSELLETQEPVWHESEGYRLRFEPRDLTRLRELPGSKGKTDRELGQNFFESFAARLTAALEGDVETPADVRVIVDPYSRQAFLAVGRTIRGIVSF